MTPAPPPARATARRILPSRAISAWLPKAAAWTRSSLSKKRTPSPPYGQHLQRPHVSDRTAGHLCWRRCGHRAEVCDRRHCRRQGSRHFPAPLRARGPEPDDRPQPPRVSRAGQAQCCPAGGVLRRAGTAGACGALRRGSAQDVPRPALHVHGRAGQKGGVPLPWLRRVHDRDCAFDAIHLRRERPECDPDDPPPRTR